MPNVTRVRSTDLRRLVQMAAAKTTTSAQKKSLTRANNRLSDYGDDVELIESPMNQGHGNTVEDYRQVGADRPLWRVENSYGQSVKVRANTQRQAVEGAPMSGILTAERIDDSEGPL